MQLIRKSVGGTYISGEASLQKVDYRYNIRGWLKSINNVKELTPSSDPTDLFAFKIMYNQVEHDFGNEVKALYNGNISQTFWKTDSDNVRRSYGYKYDDLNRLLKGIYQRDDAVTQSYDENLNYDKNGNITYLYRNGYFDSSVPGTTYPIDDLTYSYGSHSNQLSGVHDNTNSVNGFKDGNTIGADYDYDAYGNMKEDKNKGITAISYNHLNLPTLINIGNGSIGYLYNAVGVKLAKIASTTSTSQSTLVVNVDYLGGFQYNRNELQFFPTAEGYVSVAGGERFNYVYNYTDHLGNIRVSYSFDQANQQLKILEENHYFPFGLKHGNYNPDKKQWTKYEHVAQAAHVTSIAVLKEVVTSEYKYKYKYNGKEFQDELGLNWYDYGARNYDAAIGRWMNVDPFAEMYHSLSGYNYVLNNPLSFIDPTGMAVEEVEGGLMFTKEDAVSAFKILTGKAKNAYVDIEKDKSERDNLTAQDKQFGYGNWAVFSVENTRMVSKILGAFSNKSLDNLIVSNHGVDGDFAIFDRTKWSDEGYVTSDEFRSYCNKNGVGLTQGEEDVNMFIEWGNKVRNGGNYILNFCEVGKGERGQSNIAILKDLLQDRMNIYLPTGISKTGKLPYRTGNAINTHGSLNYDSTNTWLHSKPGVHNVLNVNNIKLSDDGKSPAVKAK